MKLVIYLSTCDKTSYILPATIYLYKKFIKNCPLIRILGFSKPVLPDWENIEFISLSPVQKNINLWANYLVKYFKNIDDELVFFALDDFFPIDDINIKTYDFVVDYMKNNNVGFCVVSQEPSACPKRNEVESIIKDNDEIFVYKRKKNITYQIVLQPGIWNKKYLIKMLSKSKSPWDMELNVTNIANREKEYNISSSKFPIRKPKCILPYSNQSSLSSKWKDKISVIGLNNEIVEEMIYKNLLNKDKLIIGAWNTYVTWEKKFNKEDLVKLVNKKKDLNWWIDAYKDYY